MVSTFNNRPTAVCETESRVEGTDTIKVIRSLRSRQLKLLWKPPSVAEDRNRQEKKTVKSRSRSEIERGEVKKTQAEDFV